MKNRETGSFVMLCTTWLQMRGKKNKLEFPLWPENPLTSTYLELNMISSVEFLFFWKSRRLQKLQFSWLSNQTGCCYVWLFGLLVPLFFSSMLLSWTLIVLLTCEQVTADFAPQFVRDIGADKVEFNFKKPKLFEIGGSYSIRCVAKPDVDIDLFVRLPKVCSGLSLSLSLSAQIDATLTSQLYLLLNWLDWCGNGTKPVALGSWIEWLQSRYIFIYAM